MNDFKITKRYSTIHSHIMKKKKKATNQNFILIKKEEEDVNET